MKKFLFIAFSVLAALCCSAEKFPIIFCQAQLKYPVSSWNNGYPYYSNWVDTPLLMSSEYNPGTHLRHGLGKDDFRFMCQIARDYGFAGFGFWRAMIRTKRQTDYLSFIEKEPVENFRMVPIIYKGDEASPAGFSLKNDAPYLLKSPAIMEIDGKKLFWSYSIKNALLKEYQKGIRQYGNNFILLGQSSFSGKINTLPLNQDGSLHPEAAKIVQKTVRDALKDFDGFAWVNMGTNTITGKGERIFNTALAKAVLAETAKIFAEPQYRGKIFGGAAVAEHSNAGSLGAALTSDGTRTLRNSVTAALDAGVQIINIPEWDEQNENTSLRPTVYNSFAYMRILRYLTMSRRGEKRFHLDKDDFSIPNVIISTRKSIVLGELLKIELLSIPDSVNEKGTHKVRVELLSPEGKVIYKSAELSFDRSKMAEHRLELASEKFAGNAAVQVVAYVNGKKYTGFTPVRLQATWNNDYKYAKHPLRDMMKVPQIKFNVTADADSDFATITAEVDSPETVRLAEVIENGDCIYTHGGSDRHGIWREDDEYYAFRVNLNTLNRARVTGRVTITGAQAQWIGDAVSANGKINRQATHWLGTNFLRIPKKCDPAKVVFTVKLNGSKQVFTLEKLLALKTVMLPVPKDITFTITRQLRQLCHPSNGDFKKFSFKVPVMPDLPVSTYVLQLISPDGKLYRSAPVILKRKNSSKKVSVKVWSETENAPVSLQLPENFVPVLEYGKLPFFGVEEANSFGRRFWGARGAFYNLANLRLGGGGGCSNGCSAGISLGRVLWSKSPTMVPEKANGVWTFKGGQHIALPPGVIPRRAGFDISFQIFPEAFGREQFILGCRRAFVGVLSNVVLRPDGTLAGNYTTVRNWNRKFKTRNKLRPGQWNDIRIVNDLKSLTIYINGKPEKVGIVDGPGLYDMPTTIGCWELKRGFKGKLRNLKFSHALSSR